MPRTAAVREIYECPQCGFTQATFVPVLEVLCPTPHTVKRGKRRVTGRVAMVQIYNSKDTHDN